VQAVIRVFWNAEQRRLRALWRLAIQALVWFILTFLVQVVVGIIAGVVALATRSLTPEQLADPQVLQELFLGSPVVLLGLQFLSLLISLLTVWLAGRFLDRRRLRDFGSRFSRNWWVDFVFGLVLGAVLMGLIFLTEWLAGWVTISGTFVTTQEGWLFPLAILIPALMFVMVGISEELFSRGYQLTNFAEGFRGMKISPQGSVVLATLVSSAIFGILHIFNPNASLVSSFNIFLAGILLAMGYILTGELAIPIGLHISWNFVQGNVFGFPVSGGSTHAATFIAIQQGGPDLWTGGAFGPEAGLVGVLAMILGVLLIAGWVRVRYGRVTFHTPLAEYTPPPGQASQTQEA
jgi:membrane protease YdiL (CAAX protease family)